MEYFLAILGYFSLLTICNAHGQNFYMGRTFTRWPLTALYIWSLWNERKACSLTKNTGFRRIFFLSFGQRLKFYGFRHPFITWCPRGPPKKSADTLLQPGPYGGWADHGLLHTYGHVLTYIRLPKLLCSMIHMCFSPFNFHLWAYSRRL